MRGAQLFSSRHGISPDNEKTSTYTHTKTHRMFAAPLSFQAPSGEVAHSADDDEKLGG